MAPHRTAIKIYFAEGVAVDPPRIVPLFHEWIRNRTAEGLLIDVADYSHVHRGPSVVLVGHEVDYSIDLSEGRAGLQVVRKRPVQITLEQDLRRGLRRVLAAALSLEKKSDPHPPVRFRTDELRVRVIDRLHYPHTLEQADAVRQRVQTVLEPLFQVRGFKVETGATDRREPVTVRITAPDAPNLDTLLSRLTPPA